VPVTLLGTIAAYALFADRLLRSQTWAVRYESMAHSTKRDSFCRFSTTPRPPPAKAAQRPYSWSSFNLRQAHCGWSHSCQEFLRASTLQTATP
jgi:hypothetical protein